MKAYMTKQFLELLHRDDYQGAIVICKARCANHRLACKCVAVEVEVTECG